MFARNDVANQYSCHAKNNTVRRGFIVLYREYDGHRRYSLPILPAYPEHEVTK
jgi:hypothetical protein